MVVTDALQSDVIFFDCMYIFLELQKLKSSHVFYLLNMQST